MDIVLDTVFNNPNLPLVPTLGFRDNFERPEANTLGVTDDRKEWETFDSGSSTSTWGTYGDGTAGMKDSSSQYHLAAVDGLAANGTLTAKLATYDPDGRRPGLSIRVADSDNWISIAQASASNHALRITKRVNGTSTSMAESGPALVAGDTISVTFIGPSITVAVNGSSAFTVSIPEHVNVTKHGLYAFTGAIGAWESIEFVPEV